MQWIKSTDRLPKNGTIAHIGQLSDDGECEIWDACQIAIKGDNQYWENDYFPDQYGYKKYEIAANIEWLDESAPITEDMVKDLEFAPNPNCGDDEAHVSSTIHGDYTIVRNGLEWSYLVPNVRSIYDCDDLAHGIALCNQHHKKIILSQLK